MKKKVIEYISSMGDGGAETLVKDYAMMMEKGKFDVKILITRPYPNSANTRTLKENQVSVLCIYSQWNIAVRLFNKLFGKWYRPYRLKKICRQQEADVLHVHMNLLSTVAPVRHHLKGIQMLYTCHNLPSLMLGKPGDEEFRAAEALIRDNHLRMIALHKEMQDELNDMFRIDNTEIIRNGIHMERFANVKESRKNIRQNLGIPENAFVVGHVGRFTYQKNHEMLIQIFNSIAQQKENAFLLLVGSGNGKEDARNSLKKLGLEQRSMILSNRSDIPQLMKAMDVFVFPSRYEGLPLTMVEAQAANLRCVVSDKISDSAFLSDLVIPMSITDTPENWASAIMDMQLRSSYPYTLGDYDMKREIKRLEALYSL